MTLNATGERMILEDYTSSIEDYVLHLTHIASYRWVTDLVKGKRVLDFGCGSGYGSAELAKHAATVQGVDVSAEAVAFAREAYHAPNLAYATITPDEPIAYEDASFDVVISFQVIEHIKRPDLYVKEAQRVLADGGTFVVITPDRGYRLFSWQKPWNRWHVDEFDAPRLEALLARHFATVAMRNMSGDEALCRPELDRCRKLKWATVPCTLPIYPDAVRVSLLNLLHAFQPPRGKKEGHSAADYDLDESQVRIGEALTPSLNLVAVATKDSAAATARRAA